MLLAAGGYVASQALSPHGWRLMAATAAFPQPSAAAWAASGPPACVAGTRISYPPLLDRFINKLDPASDIFPTERYIAEIAPTLKSWSDLLCRTPA